MKLNYINPKTGKPSSVNLADHWVRCYMAVMCDSWSDYDQPLHRREAIQHMLTWCADYYFDPCNADRILAGLPAPNTVTFTTFLEAYMASSIYMRACLPYEREHSKQGRLKVD